MAPRARKEKNDMAFVGMLHPVAATIATEREGAAITYNKGMVIGKAIQGNVTWNRPDNPLYADDALTEDDNGIVGGSIELGVDDIADEVRAYILGLEASGTPGAGEPQVYEMTEEPAPYVGFGYIRVRRKNGETSYQALWYHKALFGETDESAQTKGESIEWQTPTLTGRLMGVRNDSTGKAKFRQHATFDTLSAALTWLNGKAGITSAGG